MHQELPDEAGPAGVGVVVVGGIGLYVGVVVAGGIGLYVGVVGGCRVGLFVGVVVVGDGGFIIGVVVEGVVGLMIGIVSSCVPNSEEDSSLFSWSFSTLFCHIASEGGFSAKLESEESIYR